MRAPRVKTPAALPELLEACRELILAYDGFRLRDGHVDAIRQAIGRVQREQGEVTP